MTKMQTDKPAVGTEDKKVVTRVTVFDKQGLNTQKVAEVVKGAAVAYVGFQLGVAALRFIGKRFGSKRARETRAAGHTRQRTEHDAAPTSDLVSTGAQDSWSPIDAPAPDTPNGYKPIADAVLPCSPQELYNVLFSSSGTELYLAQHRDVGKQWDLAVSPWCPVARTAPEGAAAAGQGEADGSLLGPKTVFEWVVGEPAAGGYTRLLTFWNPRKPPSAPDTRCVQRQQFCVYRGGLLVFATAMNMRDIPFKECFTVNTFWRVAPGAAPGTCAVTVNLKVHFVKRAMGVGGIINATTTRDSAAFFTAFLASVERHLRTLRERAAAPLPAPLPGGTLTTAAPATGRGMRPAPSASRPQLVSPFLAASGTPLTTPPSVASGEAAASKAQPLSVWKQLRALLVLGVLTFTLLNQLHLGRQLSALRGDGHATAAPAIVAGGEGLLGAVVDRLASVPGTLHVLLRAVMEVAGGGLGVGQGQQGLLAAHQV